MKYALTNCEIFTGDRILYNKSIVVEGDKILGKVSESEIPTGIPVIDLGGLNISPGFIDLQVNGGGGEFLTSNPSREVVELMYKVYRKHGTTSIAPTVITTNHDNIIRCVDSVKNAMVKNPYGIIGMHLEGPFLNPEKKGTHNINDIRVATTEEVAKIIKAADGSLKIITIAPELQSDEVIEMLLEAGIIISAGHSNTTYIEAKSFFNKGVSMVTHLYNAMSQFNSREPGLVGASFDSGVYAGIIVDGMHCAYTSVRTAKKIIGDKLFLVSDSMSFVGANTNRLIIEGTEIICEPSGKCVNTNGDFAGTAITMLDAIRNCVNEVGIELHEALRMASTYPAQAVGLDNVLGKIKPGYHANMVIFDNRLNVKGVITNGEYERFD